MQAISRARRKLQAINQIRNHFEIQEELNNIIFILVVTKSKHFYKDNIKITTGT